MKKKKFNPYSKPCPPYKPIEPSPTQVKQIIISSQEYYFDDKITKDMIDGWFKDGAEYLVLKNTDCDNYSVWLDTCKDEEVANPHYKKQRAHYNRELIKYNEALEKYQIEKEAWENTKAAYEAEELAKIEARERKELKRLQEKYK